MLPLGEQSLRLLDQCLRNGSAGSTKAIVTRAGCRASGERGSRWRLKTHPLLPWLRDVLVGLKKAAQVQGLTAPEVPVDAPVERELEGLPVEASARASVFACSSWLRVGSAQDLDAGAHSGNGPPGLVRGGKGGCVVWPQCLDVVAEV